MLLLKKGFLICLLSQSQYFQFRAIVEVQDTGSEQMEQNMYQDSNIRKTRVIEAPKGHTIALNTSITLGRVAKNAARIKC